MFARAPRRSVRGLGIAAPFGKYEAAPVQSDFYNCPSVQQLTGTVDPNDPCQKLNPYGDTYVYPGQSYSADPSPAPAAAAAAATIGGLPVDKAVLAIVGAGVFFLLFLPRGRR